MRAGLLRHVVSLEQATDAVSAGGSVTTQYTPYLTDIAAHVLPAGDGGDMRGGEQYVSAQVLATIDTKIRIRYRDGIDSKMRVVRREGPGSPTRVTIYDIVAVTPADARRRELWLWCKARIGEGFRAE